MPKSDAQELGEWQAKVERKLEDLARNRLGNAALDDVTLWVRDGAGRNVGRVGKQGDGSYGSVVIRSEPPPQPTAPILTVGEQAGTCQVKWDGGTFDGRPMPESHGRIEVWAVQVPDDWDPTVAPPDDAERVGTIRDRLGGESLVALPYVGTWAVWLRAIGADQRTPGPWSPVATVEITGNVDVEAIEAELEDARDRLDQAEQDLAAGMADRVAEIEYLQNNAIPDLEAALNTGLSDEVTRLEGMITAADGSRIIRGTSSTPPDETPSGGGLRDGDRYEQWTTLSSGGRLLATWRRDDGSWFQEELDETYLPQVHIGDGTYGSMSGDRLEAQSVAAYQIMVGNWSNLFDDPDCSDLREKEGDSRFWGLGSNWSSYPGQGGMKYTVRHTSDETTFTSITELRPTGHQNGMRVQPGQEYQISFYGWRSSGRTIRCRARYYDADGAQVATSSENYTIDSGWTKPSLSFVVPEDMPGLDRMVWTLNGDSGSGGGHYGNFRIRERVDGDLIVDGAVKSRSVDTEEFFAAEAVIQKIWAEIVRTRLVESEGIITEDMIATGAITTPKLTVTEEMVGEVARLLRIEAGSLASNDIESMRIVSSLIEATTYLIYNANGDVSVRLDGMDNYLAGRLHAGMTEQAGISLDYHQAEIPDDWGDEDDEDSEGGTSQFVTPEAEFHSSHTHELQPKIFVQQDGGLSIDPGKFAGMQRELLRVFRGIRTQRVESVRYQVQTSNPNYPGGLMRDGDRMRIYGRAPDWTHIWGTHTPGSLGPYSPSSGQYRGTMTWSTPTPTGVRNPIVTGRMSETSWQNWRSCTATTQVGTASGFNFTLVSSSTSTNMWIDYLANWI